MMTWMNFCCWLNRDDNHLKVAAFAVGVTLSGAWMLSQVLP